MNKLLTHYSAYTFLLTRTYVASRQYVAAVIAILVRLPVYRTFSLDSITTTSPVLLLSLSPWLLIN
jgi:hypothetical protein